MQHDRVLIYFQENVNFFGIELFEISKKPEKTLLVTISHRDS